MGHTQDKRGDNHSCAAHAKATLAISLMCPSTETHRGTLHRGHQPHTCQSPTGFVNTSLFRYAPLWLKALLLPLAWLLFLDASEGAQVVLDCATQDGLEPFSGRYFTDCGPKLPWPAGRDDRLARALWEGSERLVGMGAAGEHQEGHREGHREGPAAPTAQ